MQKHEEMMLARVGVADLVEAVSNLQSVIELIQNGTSIKPISCDNSEDCPHCFAERAIEKAGDIDFAWRVAVRAHL